MNEVVAAETVEGARAIEEERATEEAAVELAQQMAKEEAKEKAVEERLRKKAVATKKKENVVALSAQQAADPSEDVYLAVFHAGAPFEMLGDLVQLTAWWNKRQ